MKALFQQFYNFMLFLIVVLQKNILKLSIIYLGPMNCNITNTFAHIQGTVDLALLVLSAIGAAANLAVIVCAFRIHRSRKNTDTLNVYIANMTSADCMLVICLFLECLDRLLVDSSLLAGHSARLLLNFCSWLGWAVSGLSLVLLNIDKFLFFCFPLHYQLIKSIRLAAAVSLFAWTISFSFIANLWLFRVIELVPIPLAHSARLVRWTLNIKRRSFYSLFMALFCVLPIVSSLVLSCYLFRLMLAKRAEHRRLIKHAQDGQQGERPNKGFQLRSLAFVFTTTVWTAFSLLPYRVFVLTKLHFILPNVDVLKADCEFLIAMAQFAWVLHYLLMLNPVINPFITATIYAPYRMAIFGEYSRVLKRNRRLQL